MRNEAQLNPGEKEQILGDLNARWLKIAGLFSKADELHQDRMSLKH